MKLEFTEAKEKQLMEAYDWAVKDMEKHNFLSRPARFDFDEDLIEYDENAYIICSYRTDESHVFNMRATSL